MTAWPKWPTATIPRRIHSPHWRRAARSPQWYPSSARWTGWRLIRSARIARPPCGASGLLLAIDQLEELFVRSDADRSRFLRLLSELTRTGRVWVAATMRNDFYDRLRQDPGLSALADSGRLYDLAPPSLADYRDIIRRPAQAAGLRFDANERRDLAAEIEAEAVSEGALPVIAFLLEQLFQERRDDLLTFETYDRLGGAAGALAEQGDEVIDALSRDVQDSFPRVVRRLVRKSLEDLAPTATSAPLSAFAEGSSERELIAALSSARLMTMFTMLADGAGPATAWVRWSHEALLTRWPRLKDTVDADRRDYETLDRVQSAHTLWLGTPTAQKNERLLADLALHEAIDLAQRWGTDVEAPIRHFIDASQSRAQARRRRRRRTVTATVAALSMLLIAAAIAGIVALRQRNLAVMEQTSARRTSAFLVSLFRIADPGENRGNSITVREVLDRGASEVNKGLEREPAVRADLRTAMAQAYSGLGLYDAAKGLLLKARADQSHAEVPAESLVRTRVSLGSTEYRMADYDDAAKTLEDAVAIARRDLAPDSTLRSDALDDLADVKAVQEKYDEAEQLCLEALKADRKRGSDQAETLARTLDSLGSVYFYRGDLPAAERTMREALSLHEKASGLRHTMTGQAMNNLAAVLYQSGQYQDAFALYDQALPIYREVYGSEHPEIGVLLNNMGGAALMAGRIEQAEPLLRQALAMGEKLEGPTHDDLVAPLNRLAMIDTFAGRITQARVEIQRAEQISRLPDHGLLLDQVLVTAADLDLRSGNSDAAAAALAEARRLLEAAFPLAQRPTETWRYALWDTVNAQLLASRGDAAQARNSMVSAEPVIARRFGTSGFYSKLAQQRARLADTALNQPKQKT